MPIVGTFSTSVKRYIGTLPPSVGSRTGVVPDVAATAATAARAVGSESGVRPAG